MNGDKCWPKKKLHPRHASAADGFSVLTTVYLHQCLNNELSRAIALALFIAVLVFTTFKTFLRTSEEARRPSGHDSCVAIIPNFLAKASLKKEKKNRQTRCSFQRTVVFKTNDFSCISLLHVLLHVYRTTKSYHKLKLFVCV